jgi:hypothetical protein
MFVFGPDGILPPLAARADGRNKYALFRNLQINGMFYAALGQHGFG